MDETHHGRRLRTAEGYLELGMPLDANAELEEIDPELRNQTEVLALRVRIYRKLEKWELMRTVAGALVRRDPSFPQWAISLAYATRRAQSLESAYSILLEAAEGMPSAAVVHYNLACYECQLGQLELAKARLTYAIKLEPKLRAKALDDEDLKLLWDEIWQ